MSLTHTSKSSGDLGVSAAVLPGAGKGTILTGVSLTCDGATDSTVTIYDNTAASGTLVYNIRLDASVDGVHRFDLLPNIHCKTGVFVTVTGASAVAIVYFT